MTHEQAAGIVDHEMAEHFGGEDPAWQMQQEQPLPEANTNANGMGIDDDQAQLARAIEESLQNGGAKTDDEMLAEILERSKNEM
mmetsp:Transcript_27372/g.41629  ORF Transcript_27372/g.41629 Transcript_27372/m.41629 type:complete len:84 (+) Transcript_27372:901-1152(+)|eukprot:CAMPEP_0170479022 /NCGR_PEP_ID=MMETSP0208-20121228/403_1 /TAXON_ID=197538 /ORGANISM="Strombidium inclinatum, Strain S3" /LENGTH=83 /DNA_ID=CAMNT_0010751361 /DNA_START=1344 /DNA_END=1595 /DNA_ORIENTATION=-